MADGATDGFSLTQPLQQRVSLQAWQTEPPTQEASVGQSSQHSQHGSIVVRACQA